MKVFRIALLSALVLTLTGCVASSHVEFGPVKAGSWVQAHEWRDANFYVEDGKMGSTFGFLSSEVNASVGACEGIGVGARLDWTAPEEE